MDTDIHHYGLKKHCLAFLIICILSFIEQTNLQNERTSKDIIHI